MGQGVSFEAFMEAPKKNNLDVALGLSGLHFLICKIGLVLLCDFPKETSK